MKILGISAYYHDSAAALIVDGEIIAAAQEERFTRKKHDHRFPVNASKYCLKEAGIKASDLDYVVFYDKPFLKFERLLKTYLSYAPTGIKSFLKAMPLWLTQKLKLPILIGDELNFDGVKLFSKHHLSHAASAFYPSPFNDAAIICIDGVGEWSTATIAVGEENKIKILKEIRFPHSLGLLYSAFTYYTGFKVNSGEYKVMGLAPYGEPKYVDLILDKIVDLKEDGSFKLDMSYFNYCTGFTMTSKKFHDLFGGPPRKPETKLSQKEMDLARSVQVVTEKIMLNMAKYAKELTNKSNLCLAGGVALNCVSNGKILRSKIFDNIWIQPASGDAGGALGAALSVWYDFLDNKRSVENVKYDFQKASLLGPEFSEEQIKTYLDEFGAKYEICNEDEILKLGAKLITEGNVIGFFQGKMEFGPRALGCRSIIGDARNREMQTRMNLKIKFRESFRPFAPSVMEEHVSDFFDFEGRSPYMLLVADVKDDKRIKMTETEKELFGIEKLRIPKSIIPAITHVDYSARLQTVNKDMNPKYHKLISEFYNLTKCPVIINTSFNVRGEPIVCTPKDAYLCFMRTEMDYLIVENYLLKKEDQPPLNEEVDWRTQFTLD